MQCHHAGIDGLMQATHLLCRGWEHKHVLGCPCLVSSLQPHSPWGLFAMWLPPPPTPQAHTQADGLCSKSCCPVPEHNGVAQSQNTAPFCTHTMTFTPERSNSGVQVAISISSRALWMTSCLPSRLWIALHRRIICRAANSSRSTCHNTLTVCNNEAVSGNEAAAPTTHPHAPILATDSKHNVAKSVGKFQPWCPTPDANMQTHKLPQHATSSVIPQSPRHSCHAGAVKRACAVSKCAQSCNCCT